MQMSAPTPPTCITFASVMVDLPTGIAIVHDRISTRETWTPTAAATPARNLCCLWFVNVDTVSLESVIVAVISKATGLGVGAGVGGGVGAVGAGVGAWVGGVGAGVGTGVGTRVGQNTVMAFFGMGS